MVGLHLPWGEVRGFDVSEAVGEGGCDDGGDSVGAVPPCYADGLLSAAIPLAGDDAEER